MGWGMGFMGERVSYMLNHRVVISVSNQNQSSNFKVTSVNEDNANTQTN